MGLMNSVSMFFFYSVFSPELRFFYQVVSNKHLILGLPGVQ